MTRLWLRRILTPILGVAFAVSMSVSVAQATEMAVEMATTASIDMVHHHKCPDCKQSSSDMKAMTCGAALCTAQAVISLPQTDVVHLSDGVDRPNSRQPSVVEWARAPDPDPPRLSPRR